jgi:hypothetical protein
MVGVPPARRIRGPHRPAAASATLPPTTLRRDGLNASSGERSAARGLFFFTISSPPRPQRMVRRSADRYTIYLYHDTDDEIPLSSWCSDEARDMFGHSQRRSQTGRLDSK